MRMKRRKLIALLMAVLMVVSLLPVSAFAVDTVPQSPEQVAEEPQNQDETPDQEQEQAAPEENKEDNEQQGEAEEDNPFAALLQNILASPPAEGDVAKIGDGDEAEGYATLAAAITAATEGQTVTLLKDCSEAIDMTLTTSITIDGNGKTMTGGMMLHGSNALDVTVKNFTFTGTGLGADSFDDVTVSDNTFNNITNVNKVAKDLDGVDYEDAIIVQCSNTATITGNSIEGASEVGIDCRDVANTVTITENTVKNTQHNSVQIVWRTDADKVEPAATVTGNTFENWGLGGEGRALRSRTNGLTFTSNVMKNANAPEEFVKLEGSDTDNEHPINASQNYWNGGDPSGNIGETETAYYIGVSEDKKTELKSYYSDAEMQTLVEYSAEEEGITTAGEFAAALVNGGEIVLSDNITYESATQIDIVGETTIDLNGHTLDVKTGTGTRYSFYVGTYSDPSPKLTIKDSSNGSGVLNVTNGYTSNKSYLMELYGTLDIQGGTINLTASKASSYGIYVNSGALFKMSGGTLNKGTSLSSGYTLYAGSGTKVISGGVIEEYYAGSTVSGWEISGGIFKTEPTFEMMQTGKVTYKISEGTYQNYYGVQDGTYVGLIGTTMYTDINAFAGALGGGKISVEGTKLTLTDDVNLGTGTANKVTFLTSMTIDLAGYDMTGSVTGSSSTATIFLLYINNSDAVVTLTDSVGGGMIRNAKEGVTATTSVQTIGANKGTFIVKDVTVEAKLVASDATAALFSYPTAITSLTTDGKIILDGATVNAIGQTRRSSPIGVVEKGYCEIDNTTINVSTESTGKGVQANSTSGTLKIGSKNNGKTKITVQGLGNEPTYASTTLSGITNSDSSGVSGAVTIANTDVSVVTEIGSGTKPQMCQGIFFGDTENGVKEIGDNVSISISGESAQTSTYPEVYGIRASAGGAITGTNVSINITHESALKTYGIYLNGTKDFLINPGTDVVVDVTKASGTTNKLYAFSTGKIKIADGLYKGGEMVGLLATGGVFDQDPASNCELGYTSQANTPSTGLWTVVPDTRTVIKNITQGEKEYSNINDAIAEAQNHDELQLMDNVLSSSILTISNINLDLNGYNLAVGELNTTGDVTVMDKQATGFTDAGTLTGVVNVSSGNTLFTKINHHTKGTIVPFKVKSESAVSPAKLTLAGINGAYNEPTMITSALANSDITVDDNVAGFTTSLTLTNTSTSTCYLFSGTQNDPNKTTINGGEFEITANSSAQVFQAYAQVLVNGGKFKVTSTGNANARIANNTNANIDLQAGYFVATSKDGLVDKAVFFANATKLVQDGKNAVDLETTDPLYAEGYRYTVAAIPVAKNGTTEYTNLQNAINEASDGDTITLLANMVCRDLVLDKNLTFEGSYTAILLGDKPLTLGAGLEVPSCFDISSSIVYIEKKNGEKIYYPSWIAYTQPVNTGAMTDYDSETCKQLVLLNDLTVGSSLSVYKSCTLDLNGHTITGKNTTYETLTVRNDGTSLVIKDSSEAKTGKITGSNNDYYTILVEHDGTSLTLDGGTIENTSGKGAGICAIGDGYNYCENTTIVINGGAVVTGGGFTIVDNGQSSRNITININGGEVSSNGGVAIYHPASGTMTLNGGIITGDTGIYIRSGKLVVPNESTVKIRATGEGGVHNPAYSGGAELTGDAVAICESNYPGGKVSADIAGGAFYSKNGYAVASYATTGQTALTGFLKGGIYGAGSSAIDISNKNLISTGYTDILNPDETTKSDYPWMIGVPPVAPTVDEEAKEESTTQADVPSEVEQGLPEKVVEEVISEISKNTSVSGNEATNIQSENVENALKEQITGLVDKTSQLKITVKSVATTTAVTTINAISAQTVTTTKAKYDVKPWVTIEKTDAQGQKTTVTREITNEELAAADVIISFRLAVPESMKSDEVRVKHYPNDTGAGNPDWSRIYSVQGEGSNRYVALEANAFSVYELEDYSKTNYVAQNVQTKALYTELDTALSEAEASGQEQTVIILKDLTGETLKQGILEVAPNVTLDLNGYDLEAKTVLAWGLVMNNQGSTDGKLITAQDHFAYFGGKEMTASTENVMPVWDTNGGTSGYVFYAVNNIWEKWTTNSEGNPKYKFAPESSDIGTILAQDSGIKAYVDFSYEQTDANSQTHQKHLTVEFGQSYLTQYLEDPTNLCMYVTLLGTEGVSNITAKSYLKAENCNFSIASEPIQYSGN